MFLRTRYYVAECRLLRQIDKRMKKIASAKVTVHHAENEFNSLRASCKHSLFDLPDVMCLGVNLYPDRLEDGYDVIYLSENPHAVITTDRGQFASTYLEIDAPGHDLMKGFGNATDENRARAFARDINNRNQLLMSSYENQHLNPSPNEVKLSAKKHLPRKLHSGTSSRKPLLIAKSTLSINNSNGN